MGKIKSITCYQKIYGVCLKSESCLKFGKYILYNKNKALEIDGINELAYSCDDRSIIVEMEFNNCDEQDVKACMEIETNKLINYFRFLYGYRQIDNKVTNNRFIMFFDNYFIKSDDQILKKYFKTHTVIEPIIIDDIISKNRELINRILDIDKKSNKSEVEKRIFEAIIWLGMAIDEVDKSIACMECVFAIERLLKISNEFFNKSIGAQLKETCAYILSDNKDERIAIDDLISKMFKSRCSGAHGAQIEISDEEIDKYIKITRQVIIKFIQLDFKTLDEVNNFVKEKRYS